MHGEKAHDFVFGYPLTTMTLDPCRNRVMALCVVVLLVFCCEISALGLRNLYVNPSSPNPTSPLPPFQPFSTPFAYFLYSVLKPGTETGDILVPLDNTLVDGVAFCMLQVGIGESFELRASHSASIPANLHMSLHEGPALSRKGVEAPRSFVKQLEPHKLHVYFPSRSAPSMNISTAHGWRDMLSTLVLQSRIIAPSSLAPESMSGFTPLASQSFEQCEFVVLVQGERRGPPSVGETKVFATAFRLAVDPLLFHLIPSSLLSLLRPLALALFVGGVLWTWLLSDDAPCSRKFISAQTRDDPLDELQQPSLHPVRSNPFNPSSPRRVLHFDDYVDDDDDDDEEEEEKNGWGDVDHKHTFQRSSIHRPFLSPPPSARPPLSPPTSTSSSSTSSISPPPPPPRPTSRSHSRSRRKRRSSLVRRKKGR